MSDRFNEVNMIAGLIISLLKSHDLTMTIKQDDDFCYLVLVDELENKEYYFKKGEE